MNIHEDVSPYWNEAVHKATKFLNQGVDVYEIMRVFGEQLLATEDGALFVSGLPVKDAASKVTECLERGDDPTILWEKWVHVLNREQSWRKTAARSAIKDIAQAIIKELNTKMKAKAPKWTALFREYGQYLTEIPNFSPEHAFICKALKGDLILEATVPFNDLDNNPLVDSYTGEAIEETEEFVNADFEGRKVALEPVSVSQHEIENRMPYDTQEMNDAFIQASYGGFMAIDEPEVYDDEQKDDDLPVYLKAELPIDEDAWHFIAKARTLRTKMYAWLHEKPRTKNTRYKLYAKMTARITEIIEECRWLNAQSKAIVCISLDHWTTPLETTQDLFPGVKQMISSCETELLDIIASRNGGLGEGEPLTETQIDKIATRMLYDTVSTLPAFGFNRETRYWALCYIRAIINGASLPGARDAADAAWRLSVSEAGAQAFENTKSWKAFFKAGRQSKQIRDIIVRVLPEGMVTAPFFNLKDTRVVDWRIANLKINKGEMAPIRLDIGDPVVTIV